MRGILERLGFGRKARESRETRDVVKEAQMKLKEEMDRIRESMKKEGSGNAAD